LTLKKEENKNLSSVFKHCNIFGVVMDKRLKFFWYVIILVFLCACIYAIINNGIEKRKGMIELSSVQIINTTKGFTNSYSVGGMVKSFVNIPYLKMSTIYYDDEGNILAWNKDAWTDKNIIGDSNDRYFFESIGYHAGINGTLPDYVEIYFFDKDLNVSEDIINRFSIYKISLKIGVDSP
jgi:hypothetical protein